MIADVRERSGAEVGFVQVQHWGRADALVTMFMHYRDGELSAPSYVYGGADGAFRYAKPSLGLAPSAGGMLFDLMAPLHFGNFAGVFSKVVWFALGFAGAYVTITGLLLWTTRRQSQRRWRHLAAATHATGYGLPLGLVLAGWTYFPARALGTDVNTAMMSVFLLTLAAACMLSWRVRDLASARHGLLATTGLALIALPVVRMACGGPGWPGAFDAGLHTIVAFDIALVLGGAFCLWTLRRKPRISTMPVADDPLDEAARA